MPKKLAVGARKAAMKGKKSASKRELIEAGENEVARRDAAAGDSGSRKLGKSEFDSGRSEADTRRK